MVAQIQSNPRALPFLESCGSSLIPIALSLNIPEFFAFAPTASVREWEAATVFVNEAQKLIKEKKLVLTIEEVNAALSDSSMDLAPHRN